MQLTFINYKNSVILCLESRAKSTKKVASTKAEKVLGRNNESAPEKVQESVIMVQIVQFKILLSLWSCVLRTPSSICDENS